MKLRTRLFLLIGALFFIAFGTSLLYETKTTDVKLQEAEKALKQQIVSIDEKMRKHIEDYVHIILMEDQARIDSLLLRVGRDPDFGDKLFLDPRELDLAAPAHSAFLFKNDQWVDFIQTTKEGELTSLLIPVDFPMQSGHLIPIDRDLSYVILSEDRNLERPFIGVRLINKIADDELLSFLADDTIEAQWGLTVLFRPETLLHFTAKKIEESEILYEIDLPRFVDSVEKASQFVKDKEESLGSGWITTDILSRTKGSKDFFSDQLFDRAIRCLEEEGEVLNSRIIQLLERTDQAIMASAFASLFPTGEFGKTLFSSEGPKGIARFLRGQTVGHCLLSEEIFFQKKVFDAQNYLKTSPSVKVCDDLGSSIAIISSEGLEKIFIGNTLKLHGNGTGTITAAVDADQIVQNLVFSLNKQAFLVHGGKIVSAFDRDGKKLIDPASKIPFDPDMLAHSNGIFTLDGAATYYQQLRPFDQLDLHFFILEPEAEAFVLLRALAKGTKEVIASVSFHMRLGSFLALLVVLALLHRIAGQITRPIAQLARATEDVVAGKLEGIILPKDADKRGDEISSLCHSFDKMITGLREKEKVKGILNKVVSPQIAQEITKGTIHLGGEERKVTVFFADIRNFTHISASLKPQEVIELLNECMTIVSHVVDECGGVIDKYVGDEVMALFGAPIEKETSALDAVLCALKATEALKEWNVKRTQEQKEEILMGIGIHTGNVLVGNMGAENRLNYTVLGSNVNEASRLCSHAKGGEILISQETLKEKGVEEKIVVEKGESVQLKGYDEPITLYRVTQSK